MSYQSDRSWSDAYIPALRYVVGPLLIDEAPAAVDNTQATDLIMLTARDMRIGCRVRRPGYAERYPWEFTIRSSRSSGVATELTKIVNGWCDWLVYAHAADEEIPRLDRWMVIDLDAFRAHWIRHGTLARYVKEKQKANGDASTFFVPFDVRHLPESAVVASSHVVPYSIAA